MGCSAAADRVSRVDRRRASEPRLLIGVSRVAVRCHHSDRATKKLGCLLRGVVDHGQRPTSAGELAGDGDVGDHGSFLAQVDADPALVWAAVAGVAAGPGGGWCELPAVVHGLAGPVGTAVLPGGFDEQFSDVRVADLSDRALHPAGAGGAFTGHQTVERVNAVAGEPGPVAYLDGHGECGQPGHVERACQLAHDGVNSLSPAMSAMWLSRYVVATMSPRLWDRLIVLSAVANGSAHGRWCG
jgi:hypothetical protein